MSSTPTPVLHVLVVGFHHKKGCQVEYSHPPLPSANSTTSNSSPPLSPSDRRDWPDLPSQWRHLPSLAMPDGSHNFEEDTAFFHLPALDDPRKTVFGISCFRQIDVDKLTKRTADITRGSVQKSVCVLSRLPLYGQIQVKMSLITEAYFREGDFSRLDLIHQTYDNLNACLTDDMLRTQQLYVGLSARKLVKTFRQRCLSLFKLLLLERRVVFHDSPVRDLSETLLTLLSLHPGMLEAGLDEAARMVPADTPPDSVSPVQPEAPQEAKEALTESDPEEVGEEAVEGESGVSKSSSIVDFASEKMTDLTERLSGALGYGNAKVDEYAKEAAEEEPASNKDATPTPSFAEASSTPLDKLGLPLRVFTGGNLCHPYLSLSYLDALSQPCVRGYLIGATNVLFKQKKGLAEVLVDGDRVEFAPGADAELRKALSLTTEDLRFADGVVRRVAGDGTSTSGDDDNVTGDDVFLDGVGWEGGDEWVRAQFRFYTVCLLRASLVPGGAMDHLFNAHFMRLWRATNNYRRWRREMTSRDELLRLTPGHPCGATSSLLSVSDVRLHLSNAIGGSEGGKRVGQVVSSTGRAVAGGINSAKGAFTSLWSSFSKPQQQQQQQEQRDVVEEDAVQDAKET